MKTDRRGFLGALIVAPLLARISQPPATQRGLLRTGGTLKDLVDYSQNFAVSYEDSFARQFAIYNKAYGGR